MFKGFFKGKETYSRMNRDKAKSNYKDYKDYEAVIGLEIHAQLNTESKMFSSDANAFSDQANTHIAVPSLGMPGALPY